MQSPLSRCRHSIELLSKESSKGESGSPGALLDCLLVLLEVSDDLGLKNSTLALEIAADVAFAEVERRPIPKDSLLGAIRLGEAAKAIFEKENSPKFVSSRPSRDQCA